MKETSENKKLTINPPFLHLGPRKSGKTTFIKHFRIVHDVNVLPEEERHVYAKRVFQDVFMAMNALTRAMTSLKISYANPQNEVTK